MKREGAVTVSMGEDVVVVKREGVSTATVAVILGNLVKDGVEIVCLDRLVHAPYETEFIGWTVRGAVTTLLTRPAVIDCST